MSMPAAELRKIVRGYEWSAKLPHTPPAAVPPFPVGVQLKAEVRASPNQSTPVLATLTTLSGGAVRVDDQTPSIRLTAAETRTLPLGVVWFDLARTDVTPWSHYGWLIGIEVVDAVTASPP